MKKPFTVALLLCMVISTLQGLMPCESCSSSCHAPAVVTHCERCQAFHYEGTPEDSPCDCSIKEQQSYFWQLDKPFFFKGAYTEVTSDRAPGFSALKKADFHPVPQYPPPEFFNWQAMYVVFII